MALWSETPRQLWAWLCQYVRPHLLPTYCLSQRYFLWAAVCSSVLALCTPHSKHPFTGLFMLVLRTKAWGLSCSRSILHLSSLKEERMKSRWHLNHLHHPLTTISHVTQLGTRVWEMGLLAGQLLCMKSEHEFWWAIHCLYYGWHKHVSNSTNSVFPPEIMTLMIWSVVLASIS